MNLTSTPSRRPLGILPCALLASLAGCVGNYDFSRARLPDGSLDRAKLDADLQASGETALLDATWVPLLYLRIQSYGPSAEDQPAGRTWSDLRSIGPVFCGGVFDSRLFAEDGAEFERRFGSWAGWSLLWTDQEARTDTPHGTRIDSETRLLTVIGLGGGARYARARPAERAPADPQ